MNKIFITVTTLFFASQLQAQVDSMSPKTGPFKIQARDAKFMIAAFNNQSTFDSLFDNLIQKYNAAGDPTGATILSVDSVGVGTLVLLSAELRALSYAVSKTRIPVLMPPSTAATIAFCLVS